MEMSIVHHEPQLSKRKENENENNGERRRGTTRARRALQVKTSNIIKIVSITIWSGEKEKN
jgi:hypothetical protein